MLRHDILARYILSRRRSSGVRQVTIRLELASSTATHTFGPRFCVAFPMVAPTRARERTSNGSSGHAAPRLGRGSRLEAGTQPPGDSRHAGHRARVRESIGGRADPELPGLLLSHHPGLSAVAP